MLRALPLLLALALMSAPMPAAAQAQDLVEMALLEDGTGDVNVMVAGTPGPDASAAYPAADLVGLSLRESVESFTWVLEVGDIKPAEEDPGADGVEYEVRFEHNNRYFVLRLYVTLPLIDGRPFAYLDARDAADGYWGTVWATDEVEADQAADTFTIALPRQALADAEGAAPFPGRNLTAISVRSSSSFAGATFFNGPSGSFSLPYTIVDDMPEAGEPLAVYPVLVGVQQDGHARLSSAVPFRASNGEATTFVYQVEASNLGDEDETFELVASGVPDRMTVVVPVPLLPIAANETVTIPILATVPFAHQHGAVDKFLLELISRDDPDSVGRLEMGVNYLAVPQPAGHHDTLHLHNPPEAQGLPGLGRGLLPFRMGTMSTLEDDTTLPDYHATGLSFGSSGGMRFSWEYQLAPALQMGLDLDLDRVGRISIAIGTTAPILQATLDGEAYVFGDGGVLVGRLAPQAPVDIPASSEHVFEVDFVPHEDADEVPLVPGSNLALVLTLSGLTSSTIEGPTNPYIAPGASLQLPLNEWHDDVDEALAAVDGPRLEALSPQERLVNPGEAVVFAVQLANPTNESVPFRLSVGGSHADWASLPDDSFHLPPETTANVTLIVRAPADALDGDRADLVLQAYPRDAPSLRGLIRLLVEVDTEVDHVDEAPLADELSQGEDAPAPSLALVALAVLAVAVGRRRRA